ncbi:Protein CBFA2T2 MTG8-like protein MTG8-related protein 1 [Takifugu flavidus]|uniref:Protein CBFA2T2 MTG8-like protein MTG8-related protein 1 n=2 Tax=Tetraodontidae TaxID=31031 RepID=A0A5C6N6L9_9TELE|nr:Protein CBFA2T2 MTG8-like protein MTG8-related protein 1 [Takifugu flavidus]
MQSCHYTRWTQVLAGQMKPFGYVCRLIDKQQQLSVGCQSRMRAHLMSPDNREKSPAMPGSPVDAKTHSRSAPSSLASSTMPPLPSVNPSGPRPASFSTTALTNGNHHSPPTLNAVPSPPQRYSNGPSSSSSSSLANQQLPATCGARQLSKLKRFLTTLQQFGNDISPEIGDNVRSLVLALVNSTVTIEEFHSRLQEATNFPLRPFVIPFLKANLPLLQRELLHCARAAKQTPAQYLSQHEHILLSTTMASSPDSSELLMEPPEVGTKRHSPARGKENGFHERPPVALEPAAKRICTISPAPRHSPAHPLPLSTQLHPTPPPLQHYALDDIAAPHILHREHSQRLLEIRELKDRPRLPGTNGGYREEPVDHRLTDREWADEWRHLDHVLNCIVDMVEKTRRSVSVLRRCQESDREELNYWRRRSNEQEDPRKGGSGSAPFSKTHSPHSAESVDTDGTAESNHATSVRLSSSQTGARIGLGHIGHRRAMLPSCRLRDPELAASPEHHLGSRPGSLRGLGLNSQRDFAQRPGSAYVTDEIWRKAEEAVNEVKRQAMDEVQKAVAEAEQKAFEMIAAERAKMEKTLAEAKRKAQEDAIMIINEQEDSSECCWNCGRKASETCSGCNAARYCGSFCQHKDWERHHLICSPGLQAQPKPVSAITAGRAAAAAAAAAAGASPVGLAGGKAPDSVPSVSSPGGEKTAVASRSSTPSTPASAPETNGH